MSTPKHPVINPVLVTYIDYSITENYIGKMASFRRCPLAPTLTRFTCLRFLSLGLPQIKSLLRSKTLNSRRSESFHSTRNCNCATSNVMQNFEERLRICVRQKGRHLSYIIFCNWVINGSNQNWIYYRLF
jgi:hypothetical protein